METRDAIMHFTLEYHAEEESFLVQTNTTRPKTKKTKKGSASTSVERPADGIYSFHPEDDVIAECALFKTEYRYDGAVEPPEASMTGK